MKMFRRAFALALALGVTAPALAQTSDAKWPSKPIRLIVPFAAGGGTDLVARALAEKLGTALGQTVIVDNKPGASGIIAMEAAQKAPPDGYTLVLGSASTVVVNPAVMPDLPYDPVKDFAPVGMVGFVPLVLAVDPRLGINTVEELIAYGKKNPGKLAFGSSGVGSTGHLTGEAFKAASGIDMVHAPYKGDAPAVGDVAAGQVPIAFVGVASASPLFNAGKIKVLAVASSRRSGSMPNVPTMAEAGYKGIEFSQWYALFARAGTPRESIDIMNRSIAKALAREDVRKGMSTQGAEPEYSTPEQLDAFFKAEIKRFADIIHRLNIKMD